MFNADGSLPRSLTCSWCHVPGTSSEMGFLCLHILVTVVRGGPKGERALSLNKAAERCSLLLLSRSSSSFNEVVQMNFEIASFSSLSGTQPITWQVEYPRKGTTDIAVSEIFISQKDLVGIVPLAMVSLV